MIDVSGGSTAAHGARRSTTADKILANSGPTVNIPTVAKCFGIHRVTAYELAKRGELGVPVLRLGRSLRVPTAELRRVLGLTANGDLGGAA